jgi:hypothetical protein
MRADKFYSWLATPPGRAGYCSAWIVFLLVFGGASVIGNGVPVTEAAIGSLYVIAPAAWLGVAVIYICRYFPWNPRAASRLTSVYLLFGIAYPLSWVASTSLIRTLDQLVRSGRISFCWPPQHIAHWHYLTGGSIYFALVAITHSFNWSMHAEIRRQQAQLQTLCCQLDPHFLFNTLHVLFALMGSDPQRAEEGMNCFVRLLHEVSRLHREKIEQMLFSEEWQFTKDYLELQKLRHGERLHWRAEISHDALDCAVPPLFLQPLVENAISHGIMAKPEGGTILVEGYVQDEMLMVRVQDDGLGCMPEEASNSPGVGLSSLRARLACLYQKRATCCVDSTPGNGFTVSLRLPVETLDSYREPGFSMQEPEPIL